jgi:hypothetical protein
MQRKKDEIPTTNNQNHSTNGARWILMKPFAEEKNGRFFKYFSLMAVVLILLSTFQKQFALISHYRSGQFKHGIQRVETNQSISKSEFSYSLFTVHVVPLKKNFIDTKASAS